jgi:hypothetical protein
MRDTRSLTDLLLSNNNLFLDHLYERKWPILLRSLYPIRTVVLSRRVE